MASSLPPPPTQGPHESRMPRARMDSESDVMRNACLRPGRAQNPIPRVRQVRHALRRRRWGQPERLRCLTIRHTRSARRHRDMLRKRPPGQSAATRRLSWRSVRRGLRGRGRRHAAPRRRSASTTSPPCTGRSGPPAAAGSTIPSRARCDRRCRCVPRAAGNTGP